jgi:hypothetical protein
MRVIWCLHCIPDGLHDHVNDGETGSDEEEVLHGVRVLLSQGGDGETDHLRDAPSPDEGGISDEAHGADEVLVPYQNFFGGRVSQQLQQLCLGGGQDLRHVQLGAQ